MSRAPVYRHEVEYGEAIAYSPPTGATKWLAWRKTDLQSTFGDHDAGYAVYGGEPPTWTEIGGYDITGDEVIEFTNTSVVGFKDIATATGAAVTWATLVGLAGGLDTDVIQFTAYDTDGRTLRIDRYAVPSPNATDAATVAAQERRLLTTLLHARERAASRGGLKRIGGGDEGEEYESLAVLDRRIAECRARIAWFEDAAAGNPLPRVTYW
ncbi:MAG: hypothetical protein J4F40_09085 [Alphaproteobacteria bacterium]|nr:hypothetical protein [Alphaproteobacteria bacterium]MCY4499229.1 hypothetical protein [Rhodospirillaceae bacterium]